MALAALALVLSGGWVASAFHRELFTTNAICTATLCINPIFPAVADLGRLESARWACSAGREAVESMNFCQGAVDYHPALPLLGGHGGSSVAELVKMQEHAAITAYAYHLSGMGREAWDHTRPSEDDDDCIRSVWRMVCYTYFPQAEHGCKEGQETGYLRPCQSSCFNYVRACGVECCDESVQCVFQHERPVNKTAVARTSGYSPHDGPNPHCTGLAARSLNLPKWLPLLVIFAHLSWGSGSLPAAARAAPLGVRRLAFLGALVLVALSAQGCSMDLDHELDVPSHMVGNWRREPDYLVKYEFIPPGSSSSAAKINSCSTELPPTLQCSGRGACKAWDPMNFHNPVNFCECSRDWADPECRTRRKSQCYAYLLSLLLGALGCDQFYLGFPAYGALKAVTVGGLGVWWVFDAIRIGSAPVYAAEYRLAADLPHWAFVLSLVTFALVLGFAIVGHTTLQQRANKRKDALLMQAEEEARGQGELPPYSAAYDSHHHGAGRGRGARGPAPTYAFPSLKQAPLRQASFLDADQQSPVAAHHASF